MAVIDRRVFIHNEDQRPLAGVVVEAYARSSNLTIATVTTDKDGVAQFRLSASEDCWFRPRITRNAGKLGDLSMAGVVSMWVEPPPVVTVEAEIETPPPITAQERFAPTAPSTAATVISGRNEGSWEFLDSDPDPLTVEITGPQDVNRILFMALIDNDDTGSPSPLTIAGDLTWTKITELSYDSDTQIIQLWWAAMPSDQANPISVVITNLYGSNSTMISAFSMTGIDTTSPIVQFAEDAASGSTTDVTVTLAAYSSASNVGFTVGDSYGSLLGTVSGWVVFTPTQVLPESLKAAFKVNGGSPVWLRGGDFIGRAGIAVELLVA